MAHGSLLITGASGFLGTAILKQAVDRGYRVRAFTRRPVPGAHEQATGDILDPAALRTALRGADSVIHAAGLAHQFASPDSAAAGHDRINHIGALNVARAAADAGVRDYVLVSSVSVYGRSERARTELDACSPESAYGNSKLRGEQVTAGIADEDGFRLTILRMATVYGENDPGNIGRLIRAIDRRRFAWIGDGRNRKSLIYRDDAAAACLLALEREGPTGAVFNVTAPAVTVNELVTEITGALGRRVPRWRVPSWAARGGITAVRTVAPRSRLASQAADALEKWLGNDEYNGHAFEFATGFRPATTLKDGIAREVRSIRAIPA